MCAIGVTAVNYVSLLKERLLPSILHPLLLNLTKSAEISHHKRCNIIATPRQLEYFPIAFQEKKKEHKIPTRFFVFHAIRCVAEYSMSDTIG